MSDSQPPSNALLSCPFCGDDDVELKNNGVMAFWVCCLACDAEGSVKPRTDDAIAAWNRVPRSAHEPKVQLVKRHLHTCANVQGDGSAPCDCGAVVNGVAVSAPPPPVAPSAWYRGVRSGSPGEPDEYDVEMSYGDDQPEGKGWIPLYRTPGIVRLHDDVLRRLDEWFAAYMHDRQNHDEAAALFSQVRDLRSTSTKTPSDRLPDGTAAHVCVDDIPRLGKRADCSVCSTATKGESL